MTVLSHLGNSKNLSVVELWSRGSGERELKANMDPLVREGHVRERSLQCMWWAVGTHCGL